jgi:alkanesulfonate monooxygenase SsuD/methylene tetrahydromethanopterin reductase-like flavin-dependent oxidoreductase (luciferase family)
MKVGVGLPNAVPGVDGRTVVEWARRADDGPFSSVGVIDRIVYPTLDPVTTLAAAAAVTQRVRLITTVLIAPIRPAALVAKQLASLSVLAPGRVSLGVGLGARQDDYQAAGAQWSDRGRKLDTQLAEVARLWAGEGAADGVGPRPTSAIEVLIGGDSPATYARMARHGHGWIAGSLPVTRFAEAAASARRAWQEARRPGSPRLGAGVSFASSEVPGDQADANLRAYYAFAGRYADEIAAGMLRGTAAVREGLRAFAEAGCDELILFPWIGDLAELGWLAKAMTDQKVETV